MEDTNKKLWVGERDELKTRPSTSYLVLWPGFPPEEAIWEQEGNSSDRQQIQEELEAGNLPEEK